MALSKMLNTTPVRDRIASLDQCRGACILLMIGGNFAGKFAFMPWILTHHKYGVTLAEVFGPVFFLMVGFSYRMSFSRRREALGTAAAVKSALRRYSFIFLLGLLVYFGHFWDALSHIGMAGLLILPVIGAAAWVRAAAAVLFLAVYQVLFLHTGYGTWLMAHEYSLNGGPLAALSWGFIILCGTQVYDLWKTADVRHIVGRLVLSGILLCIVGILLSLPVPGIKDAWPFTRYGMTLPYPVLTSGIALLIYALFYWFCDVKRGWIPLTAPLGANPLLMYAIMGVFIGSSKVVIGLLGEPGFYVALGSYIGISLFCYGVARSLYQKGVSLRIS